jgi:hypothetical protein
MEAEVLCAIINDNQRMEEKCREFSDEIMKYLAPYYQQQEREGGDEEGKNLDIEVLEAVTNEVATEYLLIANQGVLSLARFVSLLSFLLFLISPMLLFMTLCFLLLFFVCYSFSLFSFFHFLSLPVCRCIVEELQEQIFSKLFSVEWEQSNNNESLMGTLTCTIQDYLNDLNEWLTYYHYTKLVKEILILVVGHYVMSIRRKANGMFTFTNELIVANKVIKDRTILYDYFIKLKEVLQRGGLRTIKKLSSLPASSTASSTGKIHTFILCLFANSLMSSWTSLFSCLCFRFVYFLFLFRAEHWGSLYFIV